MGTSKGNANEKKKKKRKIVDTWCKRKTHKVLRKKFESFNELICVRV